MRYLVLLEGNAEKAFVGLLMDQGLFKISTDDMLDLRPHQKRQIDPALHALVRQLPPDEKLTIIRIGDTMRDHLRIPLDIRHKIYSEEKYCTKPEFEMLVIISDGSYDDYQKVKSHVKPKQYAKGHILMNGKRYDNSQQWIRDYFVNRDLKSILNTYKSKARHENGERYLADLVT
jgi:hypothetical protein